MRRFILILASLLTPLLAGRELPAWADTQPILDADTWSNSLVRPAVLETFDAMETDQNLRDRPAVRWPSSVTVTQETSDAGSSCSFGSVLATEMKGPVNQTPGLRLDQGAGFCGYFITFRFPSKVAAVAFDYLTTGGGRSGFRILVSTDRAGQRYVLPPADQRRFWGIIHDSPDITSLYIEANTDSEMHLDNLRWTRPEDTLILYASGYGPSAAWPPDKDTSTRFIQRLAGAGFNGVIADRSVGNEGNGSGPVRQIETLRSSGMVLVPDVSYHLKKGPSYDTATALAEATQTHRLSGVWGYQIFTEVVQREAAEKIRDSFVKPFQDQLGRLTYVGLRHGHNAAVDAGAVKALKASDAYGTYVVDTDTFAAVTQNLEKLDSPGQPGQPMLWIQLWVYAQYPASLAKLRAAASFAAARGASGLIWIPDGERMNLFRHPALDEPEETIKTFNVQLRSIWMGMGRWNVGYRGAYGPGSNRVVGQNGTYTVDLSALNMGHFAGPPGPDLSAPDYFLLAPSISGTTGTVNP